MNLKDFDTINATLISKEDKKKVNFIIYINTSIAVFISDNEKFTAKMVENENEHGNGNIRLAYQKIGNRDVVAAIEHFEGLSKEQVREKIVKQLGKAGAKMNGI